MKIPTLKIGQGYGGPEFYGCCGTGTRPAIFRMHLGGWATGPEEVCRTCMRLGLSYKDHRTYGEGRNRVWFYKGRTSAVKRFTALCDARTAENEAVRAEHRATLAKAQSGDWAAVLTLGDY